MTEAPDLRASAPCFVQHRRYPIEDFELVSTPAGASASPSEVDFSSALPARAPDTVGEALRRAGRLDLAHPPPLDAQDHWFRARLPRVDSEDELALVCEGLATLTDVFVDGIAYGRSESMFRPYELRLPPLAEGTELALCFRALSPELSRRRPRPRWRTRLVDAQQLRFFRTSLLGRMPGLGPLVPAVGPYRPIYLEARSGYRLRDVQMRPRAGDRTLELSVSIEPLGARTASSATVEVRGAAGSGKARLALLRDGASLSLRGALHIAELRTWWPHTHGEQPLSEVTVVLDDGALLSLGWVGFRTIEVDRGVDGAGFGLLVNGVPVFARGACFTTADFLTLSERGLAELLSAVRDAGMNMLRIPGFATYPPPAFHALCDALGILVFQELMFANMDYPASDTAFVQLVRDEARALLARIGPRPSTAILCGGSEIAQQAAMLGHSEESWRSPLFDAVIPELATTYAPEALYVAHSPSGGALPFHVGTGLAHYYGVGAYLRPLDDLRRSRVRFASECLAFANVPSAESIERFMGDLEMPFHHPRWKERVPRDRGVGWDFEDVRDHYLEYFFAVDARALRTQDPERYLALSHAAVGEAITAAYDEFRRPGGDCRGALIFWLKDLWLGAGFGLLDADGLPKSAYYFAARAFRPLHVGMTDEGLDGLLTHVTNEGATARAARLTWVLYRNGETPIAEAAHELSLAPRSGVSMSLDAQLGRFADSTYAYRFGPPAHDLVVATLEVDGRIAGRAFHLPLGRARAERGDLGLRGELHADPDGSWAVALSTRAFAQCVHIELPGYLPEDDYFHLAPGEERRVPLRPRGAPFGPPRGHLWALNASSPAALTRAPGASESARPGSR